MGLAQGGRFAGNALKWLFSNYDEVTKGQKAMSALEIAGRLGPDVLFSGMSAATTPGDIGDKAILLVLSYSVDPWVVCWQAR